jgi:uncharacterized protein YdeI (YjbR/CyaY-like superfamily)
MLSFAREAAMQTDQRIDAYIANAAPFARPILARLRASVHAALPQAEETIKWGMPHFTVSGKNVAGMAAFKAHCSFVIHGEGRQGGDAGMGQFGKIASLEQLPEEAALAESLRQAARRIDVQGSATTPRAKAAPKAPMPMPDDFASALEGNAAARVVFDGFAPSHRREYLEWITSAKREDTRAKRIAQALEWLAEGKKRNWKYEKC